MPAELKFLAIDDDPAFLPILGAMMQDLGYRPPMTAESGAEGLRLLGNPENAIDCVLLDIQMPGMDGIEVCRRIRAMPRHRETPIVMITTMKSRHYVENAFDAGATDYLTKPLARIELAARLGMVERLLSERERARSLQADVRSMADSPWLQFDFDDPVELRDCDRVMDLRALENYLLTLNRLRLFSCMAVGFRVVRVERMFERLDRLAYLDYLCDVGDAISQALKRYSYKLAHAGSGMFVAIMERHQGIDINEIEAAIAQQLTVYENYYRQIGLPMPVVEVSGVSKTSVFPAGSATRLIERALQRAPSIS